MEHWTRVGMTATRSYERRVSKYNADISVTIHADAA
jgi:hypothetical protein